MTVMIACPICSGKGKIKDETCNYCKGRKEAFFNANNSLEHTLPNGENATIYNFTILKRIIEYDLLPSDVREPIMWYGVSCSKGWFGVIYDAVTELGKIKKDKNLTNLKIVQIKEKFGSLRIYIEGWDKETRKEIYDILNKYEKIASQTCERCGAKEGISTKGPGWITTLCDTCRDLKEKNREKYNEC